MKQGRRTVLFDTDEHIRHDARREDFDGLRAAFLKEQGTVTAGNASGINDAAAALVLASEAAVQKHGLAPLARLVSYAHAGVEPAYMGSSRCRPRGRRWRGRGSASATSR